MPVIPLSIHRLDSAASFTEAAPVEAPSRAAPATGQILTDYRGLSKLLSRSVASLQRDDAAGRLPAAVWIGGSKRWRVAEIAAWVEAGCPSRKEWHARQQDRG